MALHEADHANARIESMAPPMQSVRDPRAQRRAQPYGEPLPTTLRWMAKLPAEVQPVALLRQFPRLVNALAHAWGVPDEFERVLDDLIVDRRGGRQGFPPEVTGELLLLRDYRQGRYAERPLIEGGER
jgi:hypothetical protein